MKTTNNTKKIEALKKELVKVEKLLRRTYYNYNKSDKEGWYYKQATINRRIKWQSIIEQLRKVDSEYNYNFGDMLC